MTTECPGRELTERQQLDVKAGAVNFIGGKWVRQVAGYGGDIDRED
jgi:hypothetical protein